MNKQQLQKLIRKSISESQDFERLRRLSVDFNDDESAAEQLRRSEFRRGLHDFSDKSVIELLNLYYPNIKWRSIPKENNIINLAGIIRKPTYREEPRIFIYFIWIPNIDEAEEKDEIDLSSYLFVYNEKIELFSERIFLEHENVSENLIEFFDKMFDYIKEGMMRINEDDEFTYIVDELQTIIRKKDIT